MGQNISGQVLGANSKPLPFATIKFGNSQKGLVADLDGKFSFGYKNDIGFIEVSCLNYENQKINISKDIPNLTIVLLPANKDLETVVIRSVAGSKLKRILNKAVENRNLHNPDNYDWYRCNVYYKMVADMFPADTVSQRDTSANMIQFKKMMESQHLLMTETYSRRTRQAPAKIQEQVIASRVSGFKKALFSALVTDVLPFHAYGNFIPLNGRDYINPLSKGMFQQFKFSLQDEVLQENDTIWVIQFKPIKNKTELRGTLFIHSDGFALSKIIGHAVDTILNRDLGIEQQYNKNNGKWFPEKLNYLIELKKMSGGFSLSMKGTSLIDSITFTPDNQFKFDKAHTTIILQNAEVARDSVWQRLRPLKLVPKEAKTYQFLDSLGEKKNFDRLATYAEKLTNDRFPVTHFLDINPSRIFRYNVYERYRLGLGLQTGNAISEKFSIGGWAGYGTKDRQWKYGASAEFYGDAFKEFTIKASYNKDISDPGRLQINKELDKNPLRAFLLSRVDRVEELSLRIDKKFGYLNTEIVASNQKISPQYPYNFLNGNKQYNTFEVSEASLNFRYAYGETTAPIFGRYISAGTKFPVVYGRIIKGKIKDPAIDYWQAIVATSWQKNIPRFGLEKFLLIGAASFSNQPLPLSKTFAGNGFVADRNAFYVFGGMQTMTPYAYYSDRFINFYWMHHFPLKLYSVKLSKSLSSEPKPAIGYNLLWGRMKDPSVHQQVLFNVPDKPYHETGLVINGVLRFNFMNLGYGAFNLGYFYHWTDKWNMKENGRVVLGFGLEL